MLTRLKVSGFKNLVDVDVRFGPFTCIAGANGVGKSNLFDAIRFLSALADHPLVEAALSVRDEHRRNADVRSLFHRTGETYADTMSFEAEMIVPAEGTDDLGQHAEATITFLRYTLRLAYHADDAKASSGSMEILKEELTHIKIGEAIKNLLFPHSPTWRKSAITGQRRSPYFISTEEEGPQRTIRLHQDGGSSGRPLARSAANLPRTVLSAANAAESPTALLARREMQSWRLLQLEPSALREPDEFTAPDRLDTSGAHLPATLYRLGGGKSVRGANGNTSERASGQAYARIANRLAELISGVRDVQVDRDDRRQLFTLEVVDDDETSYPARALSDGTLRFLALAVIEMDPKSRGLLCLEEPENGIHPERIPAMLQLLQDIASDAQGPIDHENPLRQVIVNTHSPAVVAQVPDDSLLLAELCDTVAGGQRFKRVQFCYLSNTWRAKEPADQDSGHIVGRGKLLSYLNPVPREEPADRSSQIDDPSAERPGRRRGSRRVIDRDDIQFLLPYPQA
jgi:predicted ATPase